MYGHQRHLDPLRTSVQLATAKLGGLPDWPHGIPLEPVGPRVDERAHRREQVVVAAIDEPVVGQFESDT